MVVTVCRIGDGHLSSAVMSFHPINYSWTASVGAKYLLACRSTDQALVLCSYHGSWCRAINCVDGTHDGSSAAQQSLSVTNIPEQCQLG